MCLHYLVKLKICTFVKMLMVEYPNSADLFFNIMIARFYQN